MIRILIVEDDAKLRHFLSTVLQKKGFEVLLAETGSIALEIIDQSYVDLMITDVMMPEMDGFQLTKTLRESHNTMPILVITALEDYYSKEKGYFAGVDDYMVKPIDVNELILRINALLRRAQIQNEHQLMIGATILDDKQLTVTNLSSVITLPQKEFYLLFKLCSYPNKIFTRIELMDAIWGMECDTDWRTIDVHINRLREKLKTNADFEVVTVRGLGYKVTLL